MALSTRTVRDPATALADYKAGVGGAGAKWLDGAQHPRADFRTAAVAAKAAWFNGCQAANAADSFAKNIAKVTDAFYNTAISTYGQSNYTTQTVAKADKWGTFYTNFQPFLAATIQSLDKSNPRGGYAANKARLTAYLDTLHAKKGTFKV